MRRLRDLESCSMPVNLPSGDANRAAVTSTSVPAEKTGLFCRLFAGRTDVFAVRRENSRTGKPGCSPACRNDWKPGVSGKAQVKCGACRNQAFVPLTDEIIAAHLRGVDPARRSRSFVCGADPRLPDDTCIFLAANFNGDDWAADALAFLETCRVERSASAFGDVDQKIEKRGAVHIARRVLQTCGQIMRCAVVDDLVPRNPVAGVTPADVLMPCKYRNDPRSDEQGAARLAAESPADPCGIRALTSKELSGLLRVIDRYAGSNHTGLAPCLMALTFARTSEWIGACWSGIDRDNGCWSLPADRTKTPLRGLDPSRAVTPPRAPADCARACRWRRKWRCTARVRRAAPVARPRHRGAGRSHH